MEKGKSVKKKGLFMAFVLLGMILLSFLAGCADLNVKYKLSFLELWARDEEIEYVRITYDGNGSDYGSMLEQLAIPGERIALWSNNFRRDGCTFGGWECNGVVYQPYDTVDFAPGDYVMKAVWKGVKYTVVFDEGEGDVDGSMPQQDFVCAVAQPLRRNAFARRGYKFVGWKERFSGETYADGETVEDLSTTAGDFVRLIAQWEPIGYTVILKENETGPDVFTFDCLYDRAQDISDIRFYREGYHQKGWETSEKDVYVSFNDRVLYNLTETDGRVLVLYPVWEINTYTLSFEGQEVVLQYGEEYELPEPKKQYDGYEVVGWSFDSQYAAGEYASGNCYPVGTVVKNVTLQHGVTINVYCERAPVPFTIRLHADDGSGKTLDVPAVYGERLNLPTDWLPVRPNFEFFGFYCPIDGPNDLLTIYLNATESETLYEQTEDGVVSLHAIWRYLYEGSGSREDPYLVADAEGMENMAMTALTQQNWDSTVVRSCFRFTSDIDMKGRTFTPIGWYKDSVCSGVTIDGGGHVVSDLVIAPPEWYCGPSLDYTGFINQGNESSVFDLMFDGCSVSVDVHPDYEAAVGVVMGESYRSSVKNVSVTDCALFVNREPGGTCFVGGIVGKNSYNYEEEVISGCVFRGDITVSAPGSSVYVGGISGDFGKIIGSAVIADIEVQARTATVSGLARFLHSGVDAYVIGAENCYTSVNMRVEAENADIYGTCNVAADTVFTCSDSIFTLNGAATDGERVNAFVSREELASPDWLADHIPLMRTKDWTIEAGFPVPGARELQTIEIGSQEAFLALSGKNFCERYVLKTDINLSGIDWSPAGVFGEFDGGGHTIAGFGINAVTDQGNERIAGFFSNNYGTICNLVLQDMSQMIYTTGPDDGSIPTVYAGGIAAKNYGTIYACKTTGKITVQAVNCHVYVGGIAGWNQGSIFSSYTECTLTGVAGEGERNTYSARGIIRLGGIVDACVNGIAYNDGGVISGCYTKGVYTANGTRYLSVAGVAENAERSFSLADLNYRDIGAKQGAKIGYVCEVAKGLQGCASQEINGVASTTGIQEDFLKDSRYLTDVVGMRLYLSQEALAQDFEAAWVFADDGDVFLKLYFEA